MKTKQALHVHLFGFYKKICFLPQAQIGVSGFLVGDSRVCLQYAYIQAY